MTKRQKKVLLFDDDYESMFEWKHILEDELGVAVELTAENDLLQRLPQERFDLICVDLMIHTTSLDAKGQEVQNVHFEGVNWQRTGLEFLQRLRRGDFSQRSDSGTSPQVPVIVLSALADHSIADKVDMENLAVKHIEKPFAIEELISHIRHLLQE